MTEQTASSAAGTAQEEASRAAASGQESVPGYPSHWEADVVLRDGRTCHIRPVRPDDREMLTEFYGDLTEETLYMRFFSPSPDLLSRSIDKILAADHREHVGLLALMGGRIIGIGTYDSVGRAEAEIAFIVADGQQGRGLGSVLLEHLAAIARENGIYRFKAEVLSGNKKMLATFAAAGYSPSQELQEGIVLIDFDIDPTHKSRLVARSREHRAESLSIARLVSPTSIAVVSDDMSVDSIGRTALTSLVEGGYSGRLAVVHPSGEDVDRINGFASLTEVSDTVDLVIVDLAPGRVETLVAECAAEGVRGLLLLSGGFVVEGDYSHQRRLVTSIREAGMRLIGPNALGLINTDPRVQMNASLVNEMPGRGRIAFFSQTGAYGAAILTEAKRRGLGISTFVSAGNRADVSANDMLQYWLDDDSTSVVLLYLESIGNPRKFTRIARRLASRKPVVAVRSGRSTQALPMGHAVRATELPVAAVDAMFDQAGVLQVDTLGELLDLAGVLAFQPLPRGPRVALISDSDALGRLADDASVSLGLEPVGPLRLVNTETELKLNEELIGEALADPGVDAVVATHMPPLMGSDDELGAALLRQSHGATKPLIAVVLAHQARALPASLSTYEMPGHGSIPVFSDVESALRALRTVVGYSQWRADPRGKVPRFAGLERHRARRLADEVIASADDGAMTHIADQQLSDILDCYGIELWPSIPIRSEEQAVAEAARIGYPVVMKTSLARLVHRTDLGGLRLSLENEQALRTAFLSMTATLAPEAVDRLVIQRMCPAGVACVATTVEDPLFGPVVSFRLGGVIPELLADFGYRIPPLTDEDARKLVRAPKASALLFGGTPAMRLQDNPVDTRALEELIARLGHLANDLPEIAHLKLNPIVVHAKGIAVLGAIGSAQRPQVRTDLEARRLL
ncbi:MAG: GNAT family N-acetyltransferase [Candidatus Nanopelagicales bacterium]